MELATIVVVEVWHGPRVDIHSAPLISAMDETFSVSAVDPLQIGFWNEPRVLKSITNTCSAGYCSVILSTCVSVSSFI